MTTEPAKNLAKAAAKNFTQPRTKLQVAIADTLCAVFLLGYVFFRDKFPAFGDAPIVSAMLIYLTSRVWPKPKQDGTV